MALKAITTTAAVAAIAVALGTAWWFAHKSDKAGAGEAGAATIAATGASAAAVPATLITFAAVSRQDVPVIVEVNGSVISLNSVDVRPQVSNIIRQVHVREGQFVRAGDPLFSLDDRVDRAGLERAQAQLLRDQALLNDLERQYKRSQELLAQNFISKSAADNNLSQLEAQRAALAADTAAIRSAQVALSYDTIGAPISGRIGSIPLLTGSLAQPATVLVTVTQLDPIGVSFPVPESRLQDLLAAARIRSPVTALVPGSKTPLLGVLSFVDNAVDPQAGTVKAKAHFNNGAQQLWPGQYVSTRVTVRTLKDATLVPQAAVITLPTGKIVYVVMKDDTVQPRKVEVDYPFGDQAVLRGVQAGERVVVEGKQNLRPGSRVRVERGEKGEKGEREGKPGTAKKDPT